MKKYVYIICSFVIGLCLFDSCLKDPDATNEIINGGSPSVTGDSVGVIKANSIEVFSAITKQNGATATDYGFYLVKTGGSDTIEVPATVVNSGIPLSFKAVISELEANTTYYIQSFAVNSQGRTLGSRLQVKTASGLGYVLTLKPDSIKGTSVITGGYIVEKGEADIIEQGIIHSRKPDMSPPLDTILATIKADSFAFKVSGLDTMTTYYVMAYVKSRFGIYASDTVSFTTLNGMPTVGALTIVDSKFVDATYQASILDAGDTPVTSKGVCWAVSPKVPTLSDFVKINTAPDFSGKIDGLSSGVRYTLRAFATNSFGTSYSEPIDLATESDMPMVETVEYSAVSGGTARLRGEVKSAGMGTIRTEGFCWATTENPTTMNFVVEIPFEGTGLSEFTGYITGLRGLSTYFVRAFAINTSGLIAYGNQLKITTPEIFSPAASFPGGARLPNSSASFMISNHAYLLGGDKGSEYTNELWAYNVSDRWNQLLSYPGTAQKWQTAVTIYDIAYVFGGIDHSGNRTNSLYRYLPNTNQWESLSSTGTPDAFHSAVGAAIGSSAYFVGGRRDTIHNEVWAYYAYSSYWIRKPDFPVKQYAGIALTYNDILYAGFGLTDLAGQTSYRQLMALSGTATAWQPITTLPTEVSKVRTATVYRGSIYLVDNYGTIWQYDITADRWTKKSTLPSSNMGDNQHCMFVVDDTIYIGLGMSYTSLLKYDPSWDN
jgi:N-acetylneuraminic acid mutarotase